MPGLRAVAADDPAAKFLHTPYNWSSDLGAYNRPGVDPIVWPFMPSANYNNAMWRLMMAVTMAKL